MQRMAFRAIERATDLDMSKLDMSRTNPPKFHLVEPTPALSTNRRYPDVRIPGLLGLILSLMGSNASSASEASSGISFEFRDSSSVVFGRPAPARTLDRLFLFWF